MMKNVVEKICRFGISLEAYESMVAQIKKGIGDWGNVIFRVSDDRHGRFYGTYEGENLAGTVLEFRSGNLVELFNAGTIRIEIYAILANAHEHAASQVACDLNGGPDADRRLSDIKRCLAGIVGKLDRRDGTEAARSRGVPGDEHE